MTSLAGSNAQRARGGVVAALALMAAYEFAPHAKAAPESTPTTTGVESTTTSTTTTTVATTTTAPLVIEIVLEPVDPGNSTLVDVFSNCPAEPAWLSIGQSSLPPFDIFWPSEVVATFDGGFTVDLGDPQPISPEESGRFILASCDADNDRNIDRSACFEVALTDSLVAAITPVTCDKYRTFPEPEDSTPPPTTPPPATSVPSPIDELPRTGTNSTTGILAALLVALGATCVGLSRTSSRRSQ